MAVGHSSRVPRRHELLLVVSSSHRDYPLRISGCVNKLPSDEIGKCQHDSHSLRPPSLNKIWFACLSQNYILIPVNKNTDRARYSELGFANMSVVCSDVLTAACLPWTFETANPQWENLVKTRSLCEFLVKSPHGLTMGLSKVTRFRNFYLGSP